MPRRPSLPSGDLFDGETIVTIDGNAGPELTPEEQAELARCEGVIRDQAHRAFSAFLEVGWAMLEIRDKRLYRESFPSFDLYCLKRWGFKKSRTYQLMDAFKLVEELKASTTVELPANEAQVRPLKALKAPEQQREAWAETVKDAGGEPITAVMVEKAVARVKRKDTAPASKASIPSDVPIPDAGDLPAPVSVENGAGSGTLALETPKAMWQDPEWAGPADAEAARQHALMLLHKLGRTFRRRTGAHQEYVAAKRVMAQAHEEEVAAAASSNRSAADKANKVWLNANHDRKRAKKCRDAAEVEIKDLRPWVDQAAEWLVELESR
jgi:hypothetical protein